MMPKSVKRFSDDIMLERMRLVLCELDGTLALPRILISKPTTAMMRSAKSHAAKIE